MKNYINGVFLYSYNQSDNLPVEFHEDIYLTNNISFDNIDAFINLCIKIGNNLEENNNK